MSISMEYYYSSLGLAGLLYKAGLLLSLVVRWLLLPFYSWWPDAVSFSGESGDGSHRPAGAAAEAVRESLPVAPYGEAAAVTCAVCLGEVVRRDPVRELRSCRHVFHQGCLDRWMEHDEHLTCPLCRTPLLRGITGATPPPAAQPSWAVERLLYLFGDDLLFAGPQS